jgi:hypothetical protein
MGSGWGRRDDDVREKGGIGIRWKGKELKHY